MTELSPEGRALLKAVRDDLAASPEDCDRIGRALAARFGLPPGTMVGATGVTSASLASAGTAHVATAGSSARQTAGASGSASGSMLRFGTKWMGGTLLLAAVGFGGVSLEHAVRGGLVRSGGPVVTVPPPQPHAPDVLPEPSARLAELDTRDDRRDEPAAPQAAEPTVHAHPHDSPASAREREHAGVSAAPAHRVDATVGAETRLLRRADSELRNGRAASALELLDEHARTFPHGVLAEERSAERIRTLCALGRIHEAREEARRFLAVAADSPLAKIVRESCGVGEDPENHGRVP